jgi:methyl-accepting chemotaxis protein
VQQAAAIEETVSSMEEMSSMLAQTAQNSVKGLEVAENGQKDAEQGREVISKMLSAMDEIHASNSRLESIVKLIDEIKSKTKVINDIVFETRLLSFNASIEAARAGAHGKGFAVVAEEVGKLAAMSGKAAEEIKTLLESSATEVSSVVTQTQNRVNSGRAISTECETAFTTMSKTLEKIAEAIRAITAASKEQEIGVKQTNQAMGQMDQVTQKNSGSAESLSTQAVQLSSGAQTLMDSVDDLQTVIFGGHTGTHATPQYRKGTKAEGSIEKRDGPSMVSLNQTAQKTVKKSLQSEGLQAKPNPQTSEPTRSDSRWTAA